MPLQLLGRATLTFWVAGPTVTIVILAKSWVLPENGATRSRFGVLPSPPGSQKKAIHLNWPVPNETAPYFLSFWICISSSGRGNGDLVGGCHPRAARSARLPWYMDVST